MGTVSLTAQRLLASPLNRWQVIVQAVEAASRVDPVRLPRAALYTKSVVLVDGRINNSGVWAAFDDYGKHIQLAIEGFEFFGLKPHAALLKKAAKLYAREQSLIQAGEEELAESVNEKINELDLQYFELDAPSDSIDVMAAAHPERFVFSIDVAGTD